MGYKFPKQPHPKAFTSHEELENFVPLTKGWQ
jgi:hypothetical protein